MKYLTILIILVSQYAYGQTDAYKNELIKLAKIYKTYHVIEPTDSVYNQLDSIEVKELLRTKNFVKELIKEKNNITDFKFINKPDSLTLRSLYLIRGLTWNMFSSCGYSQDGANIGHVNCRRFRDCILKSHYLFN